MPGWRAKIAHGTFLDIPYPKRISAVTESVFAYIYFSSSPFKKSDIFIINTTIMN